MLTFKSGGKVPSWQAGRAAPGTPAALLPLRPAVPFLMPHHWLHLPLLFPFGIYKTAHGCHAPATAAHHDWQRTTWSQLSPVPLEQSHLCGSQHASHRIKGVSCPTPAWDMQGKAGLEWELPF